MCFDPCIPFRQEGRIAIVTVRGAGMRWPRRRRSASDAPTNDADADVKSCGPGAPTLALSSRVMIPRMTVANKPGTPGRSRISVKTAAQGMPDDRLNLWFCRVLFCCTRAMGGVPSMNDSLEVEVLYPA
jgi:hypothetical protein